MNSRRRLGLAVGSFLARSSRSVARERHKYRLECDVSCCLKANVDSERRRCLDILERIEEIRLSETIHTHLYLYQRLAMHPTAAMHFYQPPKPSHLPPQTSPQ